MIRQIRRRYKIPVNKGSQQDISSQVDRVNLIRVKGRTSEIKAAKRTYHLPVEEEEVVIIVVVMRNRTKRSHGTLNPVEKFLSSKETPCKSKMKIEKGWWSNG